MTGLHRYGKIAIAAALLAFLAGCVVEPGYYGPPRAYYFGGYGYGGYGGYDHDHDHGYH